MRDEIQEFLQPAMGVLSVGMVFDKILPLFKDKNWRAKEQVCFPLVIFFFFTLLLCSSP